MDINTVILTGRLGSDIELRYTPSGIAVADVNLAVESGFGDKKKTNWIGLTIWNKSAEAAANYLGKGRKIAVSGRLDQEEWDDKETGKKQRKTRVVVENWTFADSEKSQQQARAQAPAQRQSEPMPGADDPEDDIPF